MTQPQPQPRRLTSEDRYWARQALIVGQSTLTDLRSTADKWRTGLTGLTGLVTTALAVAAPFVGASVNDDTARLSVLLLAGVAVLALSVGTWKAMTAAFGLPEPIDNDGESLRIWSENEADAAVKQLSCARSMTVVGFAALVLAAATGYLNSEPEGTLHRVSTTWGSEYCGALSFEDDGATVVVISGDGTVHTRALEKVSSIEAAEGC